jgi:threonine-phosphate decarboxylase
MIEGHGDDAWQYKTAIRADFSSNVWHGPLDPGLLAHLQDKIATVTHYPDPAAQSVQEMAAGCYGLQTDQVLVTNGAIEGIYLIAQAFRSRAATIRTRAATIRTRAATIRARAATILIPAFSEYEDACRLQGLDIHLQAWDTITNTTRFPDNGLVFLCNPNNPTGSALTIDQLQRLIHGNPQSLFVIDESYIEFTRSATSLIASLHSFPNVLILRSLTKSCRIPGLRIGFVLGHKEKIRTIREYKMPWSVNRLAIEAAGYIFCHRQRFALPLEQLLADTAAWRNQLHMATGWRIHPTTTHYFLVEIASSFTAASLTPPPTAASLKRHLVKEHGLLIRDAANFKGLTPYHFRVACQSPEHNKLLTEALRQCSQTGL